MTDDVRWSRVKAIVQAALDHEAPQRPAFLREACGDDRALRTEVESLLAAHAEAGSFAQRSAIQSLEPSVAGAIGDALAAADGVLATGDRLGPYKILGPLGAGGMGEKLCR